MTLLAVEIDAGWLGLIGTGIAILSAGLLKFYTGWRESRTKADIADDARELDKATKASDLLARVESRHTAAMQAQRDDFRSELDRVEGQLSDLRGIISDQKMYIAELRKQLADKGKS